MINRLQVIRVVGVVMTESDPRSDYPYECPKCNVCNATRTASESEDDWTMNYWECDECGFEWREHFVFSYWDVDQ